MEVTIQASEGLKREIKVIVPSEEVDFTVEERLKQLRPTVARPGFRKGKVPAAMVKKLYEKPVRDEVVHKKLEQTCAEALAQEKLVPAGPPSIRIVTDETGKPLEYTASFEVFPNFELKSLEGIELDELEATVTDQDVDNMIEKLRKQQAQWQEVDREARKGDKVVMDYEGLLNGEPFEGGTGSNIRVELGGGIVIPDLEEGIVGLKAGETKEIPATFPTNYPNEKFAGVSVVFKVTIHQVLESKLPELDEAFLEKLGIKEGGIEKLKTILQENMAEEVNKASKAILKQELLDKFLEVNPIDIPQIMVESEIDRLQHDAEHELSARKQGKTLANFSRENFRELSEIRVTLGLLFAEFIKSHEIKVDQDRVRAFIEQVAASYQKPEQIIDWYYGHKEQLAQIETRVLEDQVIDKLFEQTKINKKPSSYQDVMNYKPKEVSA